MSIATYLPRLTDVTLRDLPSCNVLPPLGQLPNLLRLQISRMDSITKIDGNFYGGRRAFPRLGHFTLSHMECLEEWNASYSSGEDGLNEFAFPKLNTFSHLQAGTCTYIIVTKYYCHHGRTEATSVLPPLLQPNCSM